MSPTAPRPAPDPTAPESTLVLPTDWVIDDVSRAVLERRLAAAPAHVAGVVAPGRPVPPGSSLRVESERRAAARRTTGAGAGDQLTDERVLAGAVLLRPGGQGVAGPGVVTVDAGPLLVDDHALAHDPWRAPTGDADAEPNGRPPFPWRPVVVVLGTEDDLDLADHARGLVNGMIRHDVEARLAVAPVPDGLHLTGPCRPTLATLQALRPDVILTLDPGARRLADAAAEENRTTVLVELLPDAHGDIEVGPLTIGRTDGRLRARAGRLVRASVLADLVRRLAAGPQPGPPPDEQADGLNPPEAIEQAVQLRGRAHPAPGAAADPADADPADADQDRTEPGPEPELELEAGTAPGAGHETGGGHDDDTDEHASPTAEDGDAARGRPALDVVVLTEGTDPGPITDALAAHLSADGHTVARSARTDVAGPARRADLVLVDERDLSPPVRAVVDARAASGRASVLLLLPTGADLAPPPAGGPTVALAPSAAAAERARRAGWPTLVLPPLLAPTTRRGLERAGAQRLTPPAPVVLWHLGHPDQPDDAPAHTAAITPVLVAFLADEPEARVDIVTRLASLPRALRDHPRVAVRATSPDAAELAGATVHVWTPPPGRFEATGDLEPLVAASLVGLPTVLAADDACDAGGFADPAVTVRTPKDRDAWAEAIHAVIGPHGRRADLAERARRSAGTLVGDTGTHLLLDRLVGWLDAERSR